MTDFGYENNDSCLIGHTGFVGSALARQHSFDACFNSKTIDDAVGGRFGTVVCAAAPGSMFEANRFPERDAERVEALIDRLATNSADRFILISSIAVLADFAGGDDETTDRFQTELAYGRNRRMLEAFVENHFPNSLIVRLPALFGDGLRKNFVFDLLNPVPAMLTREKLDTLRAQLDPTLRQWAGELYSHNAESGLFTLDRAALSADTRRASLEDAVVALEASASQFHNPHTTYQYYSIDRLWSDIGIAVDAGLSHVHLVSEPLEAGVIYRRFKGRQMPETGARLHREDMHTRHASLWGTSGPYQSDAASTLDRLAAF